MIDLTPRAIGDLHVGTSVSYSAASDGYVATICAMVGDDAHQHLHVTRPQLERLSELIDSLLEYMEAEDLKR